MTPELETALIAEAVSSVTGDGRPPSLARLEVTGPTGQLPSSFAVEETAVACVSAALVAAMTLHEQRGGSPASTTLDRGHVTAAVRSEHYFRRGAASAGAGFAPLSRFWRSADGWVRTHANYPWHKLALVSALGTSDDTVTIADTIGRLAAEEVEERVVAAGGVAAAVRRLDAWRDHPQGRALAVEPLVAHRIIGDVAPRSHPTADLPASGLRVLDLTRVIAGPVCTRYLAALGADVLRLDPPTRPDMRPGSVADTLLGKRSAMLDLSTDAGNAILPSLLDRSDVVVCGYRPGALDDFGLSEEALAERHPGLVVVFLDAWGHSGPWAGRRGFDSIVQGPTGIAMGESGDGREPGVLPCQLLDHGTGYLAAAAALDGLRRQALQGGTHVRRLSLARTAWWLTSTLAQTEVRAETELPTITGQTGTAVRRWLVEVDSGNGSITAVAPPGGFDDRGLEWPSPVTGYGNDQASWPNLS